LNWRLLACPNHLCLTLLGFLPQFCQLLLSFLQLVWKVILLARSLWMAQPVLQLSQLRSAALNRCLKMLLDQLERWLKSGLLLLIVRLPWHHSLLGFICLQDTKKTFEITTWP